MSSLVVVKCDHSAHSLASHGNYSWFTACSISSLRIINNSILNPPSACSQGLEWMNREELHSEIIIVIWISSSMCAPNTISSLFSSLTIGTTYSSRILPRTDMILPCLHLLFGFEQRILRITPSSSHYHGIFIIIVWYQGCIERQLVKL